MSVKFKLSKSLCVKSFLPASDYVINPYVGCVHGCRYCYASFISRFNGHTEEWGNYLEPKKYLSYSLPKDIAGKSILIGSVTDAYNPAEQYFKLMPPILEVLKDVPAHIEILTKNKLVVRDIPLFKQFNDLTIGCSVGLLNDADNTIFEPRASKAIERISALRKLHSNGIKTWLFISPYFPGITNIPNIIDASRGAVDYYGVENLNLRGKYRKTILGLIAKYHPELVDLYSDVYSPGGDKYWLQVEKEMALASKKNGVKIVNFM